MSVPENPKQTKNPITLKIKFKSSSLEQFIERYSVDVSKSGIFIRTKEPLSVGTQLRFEFQLQDGTALLSGDGTVVWNRAFDPSRSSVAPGMGVRFEKLSADSQKVLERILTEKARRPDSNLESRFDAGVRALREGSSVTDAQLISQATPKGDNGSFGDEPTRAMAADQVNKLAEAMQDEDPPTRQAPPPDLTDEVRRAMGAAAESVKNMTPMSPMTPMSAPAGGPPANLGRTLLGQGFMLAPRTAGATDGPSSPGTSSRDAPSVEIFRKEPSQPVSASGTGKGDSAKTPTASVDEQRARIADSHRTPNGQHKAGGEVVSNTSDPITRPSSPGRPSQPMSKPPELAGPPAPVEQPLVVGSSGPAATAGTGQRSGSSIGLIIGVVVLLGILGALAFVFLNNGKLGKLRGNGASGTTDPGVSGTTPTIPTNPALTGGPTANKPPESKIEPLKPVELTAVPVKPAESTDGVEITTDPSGVHVEFAGKTYGPTPTRVPGLTVGSQISLNLRGYQEAKIRLRNAPDEGKPLFFKLTAIERLVEVNSSPKGADVILDGKKVGKTPFVLKKLDTTKVHQIEVRRAGYAAWTHNVSDTESFVVKNRKEVLTLSATLEPSEEGSKKGSHPPKHEGASPATTPSPGATPVVPTEAAKPVEAPAPAATPAPASAPEPAKEAAPTP